MHWKKDEWVLVQKKSKLALPGQYIIICYPAGNGLENTR